MNLTSLAHSLLTGEWKLRREQVREQSRFMQATRQRREMLLVNDAARMQLYAGAEPGISRPMPNVLSTPEDYKQAYERIVLIRAARQMEEDYGFFNGLLRDFENYVVGDQLVYLPNTGNPEADKRIREFLEWQFDDADYQGQDDLTKIAQIGIRSMKRDGECGFIPVDTGDAIKLRSVSGDCIGNPTIGANVGPNNYNGVITDDAGRVILYQLFKRVSKMNAYTFDRDINADNFWHYHDRFRFQQYHGVTAFMTAIRDAFDLDQILEFTKLNIKWRSSQLPTIHTETGRPKGGAGYFGWGAPGGPGAPNPTGAAVNSAGIPQPMSVIVQGVQTNYLKTDEAVVEYPNDFPNTQLHITVEELRRQCCKGVDLPYEFAYRADNGGVVQRFWVNKAENVFARDKHLLKRVLLNRYKNRVIQKGIDTGFLDLSEFGNLSQDATRFRGQWQMGKAVSVDYGKENDTDIKLIEAGLMSPQDKAASMGMNLDEIADEVKTHTVRVFMDAKEVSARTGQPIETVLPYITKKFPNPVMTPQGSAGAIPGVIPGEGAPQKKALIEAIGIGGTQALTQILAQVAAGALPPESAINTLIIVFGISREDAAKLIPPQASAKPVPDADQLPEVQPLVK